MFTIRPATSQDLGAINDIYNHYVLHSTCTYQEEVDTLEARAAWLAAHAADGPHPATVCTMNDTFGQARVVGWGSLSMFRARSAYRHTVENSVYVRHDTHRTGIGSALLVDLIARARTCGHRTIIAGIDGEQAASIAFHGRHGFVPCGRLDQVGWKFGRWLDVVFMQLVLR